MPINRLDPKALERISGPAWNQIFPQIEKICETLLNASASVQSELTTIYIKFFSEQTQGMPFAVLWVKSSKEIILGLSLPTDYESELLLRTAPSGCKYARLNRYLKIKKDQAVPDKIVDWVAAAYEVAVELNDAT